MVSKSPDHDVTMRGGRLVAVAAVWLISLLPVPAAAHATGQSFIALLPTGPYMAVGVIIVALSILLLWFLPHRSVGRLLPSRDLGPIAAPPLCRAVSGFVFFLLFCWLLSRGFSGTRDPLENPLVLGFWVVFWMASPMVQGFLFDLWGWISPWRWLVGPLSAAAYLVVTIGGMALCGPGRWLRQVEIFSVVMAHFGRLAPLARRGRRVRIGWPGWQLAHGARASRGIPVFILVLLGTGSFDGFNETFVWLDMIGVNPLAFPGRSAVVMPVVGGLVAANLILVGLFTLLVTAGDGAVAAPRHKGGTARTGYLLSVFAPTILPIALAYHAAHYLPSLLVDGQYVLVALNDPFGSAANLLGLDGFHVTTGFFKHRESMRVIWLSQAAIIVSGHVLAVILAHANAVQAYGSIRRAFTAGMPLALFMILYTWLGLWLLAAPKGG